MKGVGTDIGTIHFVGIGGIGMSGIAEVMHNLGYSVQGSDLSEGATVQALRAKGIAVHIGHAPENIGDAAVVVVSTAVKRGNPEVEAALERRVPLVRRAEMLAELMRLKSTVAVAGTHGKTTTTSMIAALLDAGGVDPTVINGGIINSYGSNARLGASDWMVVEADESDGSFLRLDGTLAVVTNIDPEHLDHYGDFDRVKAAFVEFVENVPFYGAAFLCLDHPEVQGIVPRIRDRRIVTYGFAAQADIRGQNVVPVPGGNRFDVAVRNRDGETRLIEGVELPMPGRHNVQNALAAIGVAIELGIDDATIQRGFASFGGVKRRFTKVGEVAGVPIIDDYGHHPVEIRAVLAAAREGTRGRVIAVVQPHRYTRLRDLMGEFQGAFNDADIVYVTPVYAAGEAPIEGIDALALVDGLKRRGHRAAATIADANALAATLAGTIREGDLVVCLGAGDITKWAAGLAGAINVARSSSVRAELVEARVGDGHHALRQAQGERNFGQ
jgi:UDP-N-acetylmuramate--alanine ligase